MIASVQTASGSIYRGRQLRKCVSLLLTPRRPLPLVLGSEFQPNLYTRRHYETQSGLKHIVNLIFSASFSCRNLCSQNSETGFIIKTSDLSFLKETGPASSTRCLAIQLMCDLGTMQKPTLTPILCGKACIPKAARLSLNFRSSCSSVNT